MDTMRVKVEINVQEKLDWRMFNSGHQDGEAEALTLQGEAVGTCLAQPGEA